MDERYTEREKAIMRRKRRQRKRKRVFTLLCFALCCIGIILVVFKAPFFNITEIKCEGQSILTEKQILKKAGVKEGQNIFSVSLTKTENKIKSLPYADEVEIKRVFPGKLKITVKECVPRAYIAYEKKYALIDYNGKILEMSDKNDKYSVMTIKGIKIKDPAVGKVIANEGDERIKYCRDTLEILESNKMIEKVTELDFTKLTAIKIVYDGRIHVNCGGFQNYNDFEYKLSLCSHIIDNEISPYEEVEIDLTMEETIVRPYVDEETRRKEAAEKEKAAEDAESDTEGEDNSD